MAFGVTPDLGIEANNQVPFLIGGIGAGSASWRRAICILVRAGKIEPEGVVLSDPNAAFVKLHAPHAMQIGIETGPTATWLLTSTFAFAAPSLPRSPSSVIG